MGTLATKYDTGQPSSGAKGAYSAIVYTEGSQIIAKDADGKLIASGMAGSDDAAILVSAMAAVGEDETLQISCDLTLNTPITRETSIKIKGIGSKIAIHAALIGLETFNFNGSVAATATLPGNIVAGDHTVTVADASGARVGGTILIYDDIIWNPADYPTRKTGELHKIVSISGNVLTIADALLNSYTTTNNAKSIIINPISVALEDLEFIGPDNDADYRFVKFLYTVDAVIKNCKMSEIGYFGISIDKSYNTTVDGCTIINSLEPTMGYGIMVSTAAAKTIIINSVIENCRHCITTGGDNEPGQVRDCQISNCIISGNAISNAISIHAITENTYIKDCVISQFGGQYCVASGGRNTVVSDNIFNCDIESGAVRITNSATHRISIVTNNKCFNGTFLEVANPTSAGEADHYIMDIIGNTVRNGTYAIFIGGTRFSCKILRIIDNVFDTMSSYGISVNKITDVCIIRGNVVANIHIWGIWLEDVPNETYFDHNVIRKCNQGGHSGNAALHISSSNIKVAHNIITDADNLQKYSIKEEASADGNLIYDNFLSGFSTAIVMKAGENTVFKRNIGYLTESSGSSTGIGLTTIAHGLASTPTFVDVYNPESQEHIKVMADATNIAFVNDGSIVYWKAEVN